MTQIRRQPNCEDLNNSRWRDEETRIAPVTCMCNNKHYEKQNYNMWYLITIILKSIIW